MAAGSGADKASLVPTLGALRTCATTFFLLNAIDLPEYFGEGRRAN